ncbi:MAG: hypothetical protein KKA05_00710 [Alphaproteobacteria bacterium]|nr:hypothetical protein [Alphaproteobacteria bacterium]MBU0859030.1 hypothetical protein [Alphaproteobacteria bacterium]
MAEHYLGLPGGLTACFRTACAVGPEERLQFGAYVPGLVFLDHAPDRVDITVDHAFSDSPRLEDNGRHVTLWAPKSEKLPADIYHLLYGIERRALLMRGFYSVHAACVGTGGDYRLIVGHSGVGKTTVTHNLVEKHNMKLFSGNKTVIRFDDDGSIKAVAGIRTMTALDSDLNRYAYEMAPEKYAAQAEVDIKSIALVRINDGVAETQRLGPLSALHSLYPYFMDAVNADVIVNGKDIFDGAAQGGAKAHLTERLGATLRQIPVSKYAGTVPFLERKLCQP